MVQPLFKGLTRPALLFGVPMLPLLATFGLLLLITFWTQSFALLFLAIPLFFIEKAMAKKDPYIFRLFMLKAMFLTNPFSKKFHSVKTYSATSYTKKQMARAEVPKLNIIALNNEPNFEKLIPYSSIIAPSVVMTKDYLLLSTYQIDGICFEAESDINLSFINESLNMCFRAFSNEPVSFYFHNVRHRINDSLDSAFDNPYLKDVDEKYKQSFKDKALLKNSLFITIIYSPLGRLDKGVFKKASVKDKQKQLTSFLYTFKEYKARFESNIKQFGVSLLGEYEKNGIKFSKQLEFYNYLIGGRFTPTRILDMPLYEYLSGGLNNIYFEHKSAQINYNDDTYKFCRAIEVKDYSNTTYAGILDALMYLNCEFTITQSYIPLSQIEAKSALKTQANQLKSVEDDSISQTAQIEQALDDLASGEIGFGNYHFVIIVFGDSLKECKDNTNQTITLLNEIGILTSIAEIALPASYFSQMPCNFAFRPRIHKISTANYSSLIALHNFSSGKRDKNCWGEAVCMLKTPNKSPYYLNFHQSNNNKDDFGELFLANSLILGQSGGGKTVFMNFTFNQMQKYKDPSTFPESTPLDKRKFTSVYLDKDYGALGNILCAGGKYIKIENGKPTGFNPFMVEATQENLRALKGLVTMLVTRKGEFLNAKEEKKLSDAVEFIMREFKKYERKYPISLLLENLTEDINDDNSLKARLMAFKKGKQFGWVFDNENDILEFSDEISIYGIDGTEFLDDKYVNGILSYFILWRVMSLADGRRLVIDIDEAWKWLENEVVAEEVKNKFKTIRKQNGFLRLATQSVEDFLKLPIAKTLIEQSATKIFLPNPLAKADDYINGLNLSEDEYQIIRDFQPVKRQFLIKRQDESVIATLDLSTLGKENLMILSTGASYIDTIENIFGDKEKSLEAKIIALKEVYRNA